MDERVGIVINSWNNGEICGYLTDSSIKLSINTNSQIEVKQVLFKREFSYNMETGIYKTNRFYGWEGAKEIGYELKKIGFENVKLLYEDSVYKIIAPYQIEREDKE